MPKPDGPYADTSNMFRVHTMFRREFALLPALVRGVDAGDQERTRIVGEHIKILTLVLNEHHHSEDAGLWPRLLERGSEEIAPVVHLMESHHETLGRLILRIDTELQSWRASGASDRGEALADALEEIIIVVNEHMGLEEQRVLPLVEECITVDEWEEMVQEGGKNIPPEHVALIMGMLMYEGGMEIVPPDIRTAMQDAAPVAYADHSERVHGTPTPLRSKR